MTKDVRNMFIFGLSAGSMAVLQQIITGSAGVNLPREIFSLLGVFWVSQVWGIAGISLLACLPGPYGEFGTDFFMNLGTHSAMLIIIWAGYHLKVKKLAHEWMFAVIWMFMVSGYYVGEVIFWEYLHNIPIGQLLENLVHHWQILVSLYLSTLVGAFYVRLVHPPAVAREQDSRELTALRRVEECIHDKDSRLRAIVEAAGDGIVTIDEQGIIETFNPAAERMFGYAAREMIGQPVTLLMPEPHRSQHHLYLARYLQTGQARVINQEREVLAQRKDGSMFPIALMISEFWIGQTRMFTGIIRDITERKQAEEQLQKLSRAVEQSESTIVITDLSGTIEFVNPAFTKKTGYSQEEAIGENPRILKSGAHSPEFYQELWETISTGDVWQGEFINRKKNGALYWESAIITPVKDRNNKITHYLAIKDDVTEHKLAEEALAKERNLLRTLINHLPDYIYIKDTQSRFVLSNDTGIRSLHLTTLEDLIGKNGL